MDIPAILPDLVQRFRDNLEDYKAGHYNETQVRREFIDPLFTALGWDVANTQGYAEAYKEVVHEDAIRVGRATKAPDYSFRIGGVRKFFLEAKKPSVNLKDAIPPAFQLRRYAWSAGLPLSVLTDFEEFAVYDCRIKPVKTDKASHSRIFYLTFDHYLDRWQELYGIFSPQAILKGSFDRFAAAKKGNRGTAEVDVEFLKEIELWRELLARNFALRNPGLGQSELNLVVQLTIDRIIFLRICEDRGIEPYGALLDLCHGGDTYRRLFTLFRQADDRYNSGLFHFRGESGQNEDADTLTPNLFLDDKPLQAIFKNLYYPDSPYEFSVLGADILGQVYERFLGKIIRLTAGHQAKIEEKPEVRKAGGVFYTPAYIVDYLVRHTVLPLLADKRPGPRGGVSRLRILDPACGSGSFLLGAYQLLLDWHRDQYAAEPERWTKGANAPIYQDTGGDWRLTTDEKKRILINNIFGVDIDPQAVEVTKLSLLLKVLEGEDEQTVRRQLTLFRQRVLPNLDRNIKCGNSLVGPDWYSRPEAADPEAAARINPFSWIGEFPDIMAAGGFDAVIGNPPYVRQELLSESKPYLQAHYQTYHGVADLYVFFIEQGISLLNEHGRFGIIVANKWMRAGYGKPLRQWLQTQAMEEIVDFGDLPVFQDATTYPCLLRVGKEPRSEVALRAALVQTLDFPSLDDYVTEQGFSVSRAGLSGDGWTLVDDRTRALLDKIRAAGVPLGEYVGGEIYYGIKTGLNEAFVIDGPTRDRLLAEDPNSGDLIKPFVVGRDIKRYQPISAQRYLIFTRRGVDIARYPAIHAYLQPFKPQLMPQPSDWRGGKWPGRKPGKYAWYEIQDTVAYFAKFEDAKIISPAIIQKPSFLLDSEGYYSNDKTSIIMSSDPYVLGILNSSLVDFFMRHIASTKQGGYYEYKPMYLNQVVIHPISPTDAEQHDFRDRIATLAETLLGLNRELASTGLPHLRQMLNRRIEAADRQLDALVYQLYGLDDEEIRLVEQHLRG